MRSFTALSLVSLPRNLDVYGALALGTELLTAAEGEVAAGALAALERLERCHTALQDSAAAVQAIDPQLSDKAKQADRRLDASYRALDRFLDGLASVPGDPPEAQKARAIRSAIFPEGLGFTLFPFKLEWAASETSLLRLQRGGYDTAIIALGGGPIVESLRKAHEEYGVALRITEATPRPTPATLRPAFDKMLDALRAYIVAVVATVDVEQPPSQEKANNLLAPLAHWPKPRGKDGGETVDPVNPPVVEPAPPSGAPA